MSEGYVLAIKPSARRASRAVGTWVHESGPRRTFETKELARRWARAVSGPGTDVWVQDAAPADRSAVDGYLVAGERRGRAPASGEQPSLDAVRSARDAGAGDPGRRSD
ncbi:MAG: hypothetical protein ABEJ23_10550 [Haloarculaceae archaeon]